MVSFALSAVPSLKAEFPHRPSSRADSARASSRLRLALDTVSVLPWRRSADTTMREESVVTWEVMDMLTSRCGARLRVGDRWRQCPRRAFQGFDNLQGSKVMNRKGWDEHCGEKCGFAQNILPDMMR